MAKFRPKISRGSLVGLMLVLVLFGWAYMATPLFHFNLLDNSYSYDPRIQEPDQWILKERPELYVKQYLTGQIDTNRTFPANAGAKITTIEPTQVKAGTILFNDWQLGIWVDVDISYDNGTLHHSHFTFTSGGSEGFEIGSFALTYRAVGHPLTQCREDSPDVYSCS